MPQTEILHLHYMLELVRLVNFKREYIYMYFILLECLDEKYSYDRNEGKNFFL